MAKGVMGPHMSAWINCSTLLHLFTPLFLNTFPNRSLNLGPRNVPKRLCHSIEELSLALVHLLPTYYSNLAYRDRTKLLNQRQ